MMELLITVWNGRLRLKGWRCMESFAIKILKLILGHQFGRSNIRLKWTINTFSRKIGYTNNDFFL